MSISEMGIKWYAFVSGSYIFLASGPIKNTSNKGCPFNELS